MRFHHFRARGWAARMPIVATLILALSPSGSAQPVERAAEENCQAGWTAEFPDGSLDGPVMTLKELDIGDGPRLYASGGFRNAGGRVVNHIASWNGRAWSPLGKGLNEFSAPNTAYAMAAFDEGGGAAIFVAGSFATAGGLPVSGIARWDGQNWSAVGESPATTSPGSGGGRALAVFDDGSGLALYMGGTFSQVGGVPASRIARWNGREWQEVGGGMAGSVYALQVFDDGTGAALYAGGNFTQAGGAPAQRMARWNGRDWAEVGGGVDGAVRALAAWDDGSGTALYAGGSFSMAGGLSCRRIARWDGERWHPLGAGIGGAQVRALAPVDALLALPRAGGSAVLIAGGTRVAQWEGDRWSILGDATGPSLVNALAVYDDGRGDGPSLYAAAGSAHGRVYRWDGREWSIVGASDGPGSASGRVWALRVFDDGSGPALYAGGSFDEIDGVLARGVARWDGHAWSDVGGGIWGYVMALAEWHDPGRANPSLVAAGAFVYAGSSFISGVAKWDGRAWSGFGAGVTDDLLTADAFIHAAAAHRFAPAQPSSLLIGGSFQTVGGRSAGGIARWATCARAGAAPATVQVVGDVNVDGRVDAADVVIVLTSWGACPAAGRCAADVDASGSVDAGDLMRLLEHLR